MITKIEHNEARLCIYKCSILTTHLQPDAEVDANISIVTERRCWGMQSKMLRLPSSCFISLFISLLLPQHPLASTSTSPCIPNVGCNVRACHLCEDYDISQSNDINVSSARFASRKLRIEITVHCFSQGIHS